MVNEDLAKEIIPDSGCYSVIGPNEDLEFTKAVVLWSSLYHLMFTHNINAMKHNELKKYLQNTSQMFEVDISYFSKSKQRKRGYTKDILSK